MLTENIQVLVAIRHNSRELMQNNALQVARRYEKEAKERLRHISLAAAGLDSVKAKRSTSGPTPGSGLDETWYEENRNTSYRDGVESLG